MPKQKIILSLMGKDAYADYVGYKKRKMSSRYLTILTLLIQPFVAYIISKSKNIEKYVWLKKKSVIIPNGIDINRFKPTIVKKNNENKTILFLGDKFNIRKNFKLVEESISLLKEQKINLITPYPSKHETIVSYMNSCDILVFPSFMEGSPNVIKEAMACNCPIVATNVGDIEWLFGGEPGCYLADFTSKDFAKKIEYALRFAEIHKKTNGRNRLIELGLDSDTVAKKIINIYKKLLNNNENLD
ncbi:D-inositol-3-phosphate glycosyltransferase [bioreactor metagenome]|uniref:D-inositol-3-phosphate glycosyltransferase n=1 Tax=bioreactor metagenome TaxID=1076179 RepID=A0A645B0A2_9ZZZZ